MEKPGRPGQNVAPWGFEVRIDGSSNSPGACDGAAAPVVQLVDFDPAWGALVTEWLQGVGMKAVMASSAAEASAAETSAAEASAAEPAACDLVLLNLPFPRHGGTHRVRQLHQRWPQTPVLLLSPTIQPGVQADGQLARELGVQGLVAMPVARDALLAAVRKALLATPRRSQMGSAREALLATAREALLATAREALRAESREP